MLVKVIKVKINCLTFKRQPHKMVKHTQVIRRNSADELFECVWRFCGLALNGLANVVAVLTEITTI